MLSESDLSVPAIALKRITCDYCLPQAKINLAVTLPGEVSETPPEKTGLKAMLDDLPKLVTKFAAIEDQVKIVMTSVGVLTDTATDAPLLLSSW